VAVKCAPRAFDDRFAEPFKEIRVNDKNGRVALYAGSFDPVHYGHVDIANRAKRLFDHVVVGIVDMPSKSVLFSQEERVALFRDALNRESNISVLGYSGLTVAYAKTLGATVLVRGLRAAPDFEYEHQLTGMNRHLQPDLETIFLMTSPERSHLSSSLIKEVAAQGVELLGLVPAHVATALTQKLLASGV
jgi:pantetheine-phosphate adenylyltransferase